LGITTNVLKGLFVGSGSALANGGPASLVLAYGLIGIMLYCTVHPLGELAVAFPIAGAFSVYSSRFVDPAWGFAIARFSLERVSDNDNESRKQVGITPLIGS
jgi:amino acid transporter